MVQDIIMIDHPFSPAEAKRNAERCIAALRHRFLDTEFFGIPGDSPTAFMLKAEAGARDVKEEQLFAQGFMASVKQACY